MDNLLRIQETIETYNIGDSIRAETKKEITTSQWAKETTAVHDLTAIKKEK